MSQADEFCEWIISRCDTDVGGKLLIAALLTELNARKLQPWACSNEPATVPKHHSSMRMCARGRGAREATSQEE
jgi:hypothetical protein